MPTKTARRVAPPAIGAGASRPAGFLGLGQPGDAAGAGWGEGGTGLAVFVGMEHPGDVSVQWLSILDEVDVMRRYVVLLLVPSGQAIFHEVVPLHRVLDPRALVGVGTVVAMVAIAWR